MALNRRQDEMREGVRRFANVQGTTALLRHPDAEINDYINRALGSLHRKLTSTLPDQRYLASTTVSTSSGTATYALGVNFDSIISLELAADGHRSWLQAYEMSERPMLVSPDVPTQGIPFTYRLRGSNIELLPTPQDVYTVTVWYVPTTTQLASDSATFDTISRLDDFIIAYAGRLVAIKDKNWDLAAACKDMLAELDAEIVALARNVDRNSPPRVVDTYAADRWGRRPFPRRGWR